MVTRKLKIVVRMMALLMAILVALPAIGLGSLQYFCTMTGEVGPKCCCQHEADGAELDVPSVSAGQCCEVVSAERQVLPTRVEVITPDLEGPQFVLLPQASSDDRLLVRAPTRLAVPHGSRGPPPATGPPLFIQHSSFLI